MSNINERGDELDNKNKQIEEALFNTALGYYIEDIDEVWAPKVDKEGNKVLDSNGDPILELVNKKKKKKYVPGGVMAQREWLKVNYPEKYNNSNKEQFKSGLKDVLEALNSNVEELFEEDDN